MEMSRESCHLLLFSAPNLHDGTGQEQHETPFRYEKHLTLDVKGLVDILEKINILKIFF